MENYIFFVQYDKACPSLKEVMTLNVLLKIREKLYVLVNQNHTAPLMTIFLLHTKCIVKQCNFQSPAEMWTKQKVKFLELRKIIIYWLLRHLSIFLYYFTQAIYPWIFQFPHIFIQKSKYIHYDLRIFFTHFNAVKRPQKFFFF